MDYIECKGRDGLVISVGAAGFDSDGELEICAEVEGCEDWVSGYLPIAEVRKLRDHLELLIGRWAPHNEDPI